MFSLEVWGQKLHKPYFPNVHFALLFRIDKSSLGVSHIGVATPWDDCPYAKSNANTFVRARAYRVFLTSCVGINLGDIPRGLRHPWDVPSVDPSTLGRKTLYELASLKYCYNNFSPMDFPNLTTHAILKVTIHKVHNHNTQNQNVAGTSNTCATLCIWFNWTLKGWWQVWWIFVWIAPICHILVDTIN